jgi:uncharacterized protein YndB with AHSA1/START domain
MTRTDTASRVINAPRERIYRAFVDPESLVRWLPPAGMSARMDKFDPRVGGGYRMTLTYDAPDASVQGKSSKNSDVVEGRFTELVPNERIVQVTEFDSDDPAFAGAMTMTWSLADAPGGTEVTIRADNVPEGISKQDHDAGLKSSLENLAAFSEGRA